MIEKRFVYADNAATSPLSEKALEAMLPFMRNNYANASQPYSYSREAKRALKQAREIIASCIGASPDEVYFTSGGSESNNWVIRGAIDFGIDIITSEIEHHSILRPVEYSASKGNSVGYIPVSDTGIVGLPDLFARIANPGSLISIMLANNEIGTIQHIADLARLTHDYNGIFHTDAVQALGHIVVNVRDLGVDMLSGSAHKFNGPKGIGFLYIRKGMSWPSLIKGGAQERMLRAGTENIASIVGMATALEENVGSLEGNMTSLVELERHFLYELTTQGVQFHRNGDSNHIPGNISLSFRGVDGEMLLHRLDLKGIMVSTGSACDSKETQISHVLKAIGLSDELGKGTIRVSFGKHNSKADVEYLAKELAQIINPSSFVSPKHTPSPVEVSAATVNEESICSVSSSEPEDRYIDSSALRPERGVAFYLDLFSRLRGKMQNKGGSVSPHKPILLITIFDLIKTGDINSNRIYFNDLLRKRFVEIWCELIHGESDYHPNFSEPFARLASSPFYSLKLRKPIKEKQRAWTAKRVSEYIEYAEIDIELFNLVKTGTPKLTESLIDQIH